MHALQGQVCSYIGNSRSMHISCRKNAKNSLSKNKSQAILIKNHKVSSILYKKDLPSILLEYLTAQCSIIVSCHWAQAWQTWLVVLSLISFLSKAHQGSSIKWFNNKSSPFFTQVYSHVLMQWFWHNNKL